MVDYREELLAELLNCGYYDVSLLKDCKYSFGYLIENCKYAFGNDVNVNNLVRIMFEIGIDEIEEHESLLLLNPREDIESFHNYIDTSIWVAEHKELYKRYLQDELDRFYEMTGFEISTD